jgi:hypothetical protein
MKRGGESNRARTAHRQEVHPLEGLRAVQIGTFQILKDVPWFPNEAWHLIPVRAPDVLVGTRDSLRRLCQYVTAWRLDFSFIDRALFVLTQVGERPLSDQGRDEFWRVFGVPVFELFVSGDGVILAHECEAHEGWHVNTPAAQFVRLRGEAHMVLRRILPDGSSTAVGIGFTGAVTRQACACGRQTERVVNLPVSEPEAEASFALVPIRQLSASSVSVTRENAPHGQARRAMVG